MKKMMEEEEQESSVCKLNYTNYDGFSDGLKHSWKNALTAQTRLWVSMGPIGLVGLEGLMDWAVW